MSLFSFLVLTWEEKRAIGQPKPAFLFKKQHYENWFNRLDNNFDSRICFGARFLNRRVFCKYAIKT